jgi:hypothetical protein
MKSKKTITKKPKQFGRRPILMSRYDGGIRIIYPSGNVDWEIGKSRYDTGNFSGIYLTTDEAMYACTCGDTQEETYNNCLQYDREAAAFNWTENQSAFLGYL